MISSAVDLPAATQVPSAPATLCVLGPLVVRQRGGRSGPVEMQPRAGRQRRLLTILAASAGGGRPVTAEQLVDGLYGPHAGERARHSLATEVWRARQVLGARAIVTGPDGYALDSEHCDVDAVRFERLLMAGRAGLHAGDAAGAEQQLGAALDLWRGDPLPDWQEHPAGRAAAVRLAELHAGGRVDHAEALAAIGRPDRAAALLEAVTAAEPTREHAWALLVEVYAALGRDRAARAAFDTARRTLADYGVDVGAELAAARRRLGPGAAATPHPRRPGRAGPPPARRPAVEAGPPTLVGREDERGRLAAVLAGILERRRRGLVLVTGEAGIGKTALVESVLSDLPAGTAPVVVTAQCDRRIDLPYGPVVSALRRLPLPEDGAEVLGRLARGGDDPSGAAAGAGSRAELNAAVADALEQAAAGPTGLVLFVEDAHWAPAETLDALATVAARRAGVALALVLTVRDPVPNPPAELPELRRRAELVLALDGLDRAATAALVGPDRSAEDVDRLHRLTGGNPLYLRHVRDLRPGATARRVPTLDDALDDHLSAVSASSTDVVRLAAVIGLDVAPRLLVAAAARLSPPIGPAQVDAAVDEALRAGLWRQRSGGPAGDGYAWVHELLRERLYAGVPADVRADLHLVVAQASERLVGSSTVPVDLVAHHYAAAWPRTPTEVAVTWLARAGGHAMAQLAFSTAARYYRRAGDLIGLDPSFDDRARRADLVESEGQALLAAAGLHDAVRAEDDLRQARALFRTLLAEGVDGPALRLRAAMGVVRTYAGRLPDAMALDDLADALDGVLDDGRPDAVAHAVGEALTQLRVHRPARAAQLLDRAVSVDPSSSGPLRAAAWAQQPVLARLDTARLLVRDPTADPLGAWVRLWVSEVGAGARAIDDPPPGRPDPDLGSARSRWEVAAWEISVALAGGRFARAERLLDAAALHVEDGTSAADIATRASAVAGQRVRLALLRSGSTTVPGLQSPTGTWFTSHPLISTPVIRAWAAYMDAISGRLDVASRACDDLLDQYADGLVAEGDLLPWACGLATAAVLTGHRPAAEFLRDVLAPHRGHVAIHTFTAYWGSVDHHLGRLAVVTGDLDEAAALLTDAVRQARASHARAYEARALADLADALERRGSIGDAGARPLPDVGDVRQQAAEMMRGLVRPAPSGGR